MDESQEDLAMERVCEEYISWKQAYHQIIGHRVPKKLRIDQCTTREHTARAQAQASLKMVQTTCMKAQILQDTTTQ